MLTFILLAQAAVGAVKNGAKKIVDWASTSEKELIAAIIEGNQAAFSWLVRKHWGSMLRVATSLVRREQVAMEIVQETWETVFKELVKFRGESSLKNWIYRIMVNRAKRVGQKEARSIAFSSLAGHDSKDSGRSLEDEFTAKGNWKSPVHGWRMIDPQNEAINREGVALLGRALEDLPEAQKVVVTMRDVEGLDSKETCELLGITESNQRVLLHRGRNTLRQVLEAAENTVAEGAA